MQSSSATRKICTLSIILVAAVLAGNCAYQAPTVVEKTPEVVAAPPELPALRRIWPTTLSNHAFRVMDYVIAPWFRFKDAAVSITFDDGTLDQYQLAYPELEKRNLKATFFLISDYLDDGYWQDFRIRRRLFSWSQARELARAGHEIGSHSKTHAARLLGSEPFVEEEIRDSRARIEAEIRARRCVSFSWPFWANDDQSRDAARKYYIAARAGGASAKRFPQTNGGMPSRNPADIYQINSMGILSARSMAGWQQLGREIVADGAWAVINLHGIDDGYIARDALGWEALPLDKYRALLDYVRKPELWVTPLGSAARYIYEREAALLSLVSRADGALVLNLTDSLDNALFDQALTVRLRLGPGWRLVEVRQADEIMWSYTDDDGFVVFDAFPDAGAIVISRLDLKGRS